MEVRNGRITPSAGEAADRCSGCGGPGPCTTYRDRPGRKVCGQCLRPPRERRSRPPLPAVGATRPRAESPALRQRRAQSKLSVLAPAGFRSQMPTGDMVALLRRLADELEHTDTEAVYQTIADAGINPDDFKSMLEQIGLEINGP